MEYTKITVTTNHSSADMVSETMFELGADGVSIDDPADFSDLIKSDVIWDYLDNSKIRTDDKVYVSTLVERGNKQFVVDLQSRLDALKQFGIVHGEICSDFVKSEDWENEWRKYYKPIALDTITIVPSWIDYAPKSGENVIRLDPGMAFGTGSHATTRMCLQLMDVKDKDVIDVGCGSGILGIAAAICGAKSVYMCDIDPQAVQAAQENARFNSVTAEIEQTDLIQGTRKADFVFANLTADILMRLAPNLFKHMNSHASIAVSGIIDTRLQEVKDCFLSLGYTIEKELSEDDWRAMLLKH